MEVAKSYPYKSPRKIRKEQKKAAKKGVKTVDEEEAAVRKEHEEKLMREADKLGCRAALDGYWNNEQRIWTLTKHPKKEKKLRAELMRVFIHPFHPRLLVVTRKGVPIPEVIDLDSVCISHIKHAQLCAEYKVPRPFKDKKRVPWLALFRTVDKKDPIMFTFHSRSALRDFMSVVAVCQSMADRYYLQTMDDAFFNAMSFSERDLGFDPEGTSFVKTGSKVTGRQHSGISSSVSGRPVDNSPAAHTRTSSSSSSSDKPTPSAKASSSKGSHSSSPISPPAKKLSSESSDF